MIYLAYEFIEHKMTDFVMLRFAVVASALTLATVTAAGATWMVGSKPVTGVERSQPISTAPQVDRVRVVYPGYGIPAAIARAAQIAQDRKPATAAAPLPASNAVAIADKLDTAALGTFDLHSATVEELNSAGAGMIGRAVAKGRPYRSVDDLLAKRVLNRTAFEAVKHRLRVGV